ncbi:MAG: Rdx family [Betaproteobacteria bacterium]|jgi:selenoprotein W-related protein|nr:Rdx family [Betaproteobacteria bacterium]
MQGSGGIFDITADGALVYSKHRTGRFPENAEVLQALRSLSKG